MNTIRRIILFIILLSAFGCAEVHLDEADSEIIDTHPNDTGTGDIDTDSDADTDTDSDGDGDADTDSDADTDADADGDADTDSDADTDADTDSDTDTDTDTDSDTDTDTDADTDSDTDADTDADTDSDTDADTDADTDSDTDADTDADTDSDTDTDTDADTDSDTDADTDSDSDTDCDQPTITWDTPTDDWLTETNPSWIEHALWDGPNEDRHWRYWGYTQGQILNYTEYFTSKQNFNLEGCTSMVAIFNFEFIDFGHAFENYLALECTDKSNPTENDWTEIWRYSESQGSYNSPEPMTADIDATCLGSTTQFRFGAIGNDNYGIHYYAIDDFEILKD